MSSKFTILLEKNKMRKVILGITFFITSFSIAQESQVVEQKLSNEAQINLATHFLPDKDKKEAKVLAYSNDAEMIVLRDSDSYLTCVGDNPKKEGIQIVCYYSG